MRSNFIAIILTGFCANHALAQTSSGDLTKLMNAASFIVPSSPAFELLPDKASEVTHIVTSHDLLTNLVPVVSNGKLSEGMAFDGRPFMLLSGSLTEYQQSYWKRLAFRTVLSVGTAAIPDSKDMLVSGGIKIPLIDKGDPRNSAQYIDNLEASYLGALSELGPPPFNATEEILSARAKYASSRAAVVRDSFMKNNWNASRLDVGGALMYRSSESKLSDLKKNRNGVWIASSFPLGRQSQLLISAKSSWVNTDSVTQESERYMLGSRFRWFGGKYEFGLSVEASYIWSRYSESAALNEGWSHFAGILELPIPKLNSYLGLAFGFDGSRREDTNPSIEFRYAIYTDRLVKK